MQKIEANRQANQSMLSSLPECDKQRLKCQTQMVGSHFKTEFSLADRSPELQCKNDDHVEGKNTMNSLVMQRSSMSHKIVPIAACSVSSRKEEEKIIFQGDD